MEISRKNAIIKAVVLILFYHSSTNAIPLVYDVGAKQPVTDAEMLTFAMGTAKAPTVCDATAAGLWGATARCVSDVEDPVATIRTLFTASVRFDMKDNMVRVMGAPWANVSTTGGPPSPESYALAIVSIVLGIVWIFVTVISVYCYCHHHNNNNNGIVYETHPYRFGTAGGADGNHI